MSRSVTHLLGVLALAGALAACGSGGAAEDSPSAEIGSACDYLGEAHDRYTTSFGLFHNQSSEYYEDWDFYQEYHLQYASDLVIIQGLQDARDSGISTELSDLARSLDTFIKTGDLAEVATPVTQQVCGFDPTSPTDRNNQPRS